MNTELLNNILDNQRNHWANVVRELINGKKETHWCWYFLPNVPGLGQSAASKNYALEPQTFLDFFINSSEYRGNLLTVIYLIDKAHRADPKLDLENVLGEVDALKFKSFMTLLRIMWYRHPDDINLPAHVDRIVHRSMDIYGSCYHTVDATNIRY